jgi:hypothetical protein
VDVRVGFFSFLFFSFLFFFLLLLSFGIDWRWWSVRVRLPVNAEFCFVAQEWIITSNSSVFLSLCWPLL